MSKFEKEVLKVLDDKQDNKKIAELAYKKAKGKVDVELANLKATLAEKEFDLAEAQENLEIIKFSTDFNMNVFDEAKAVVDELDDEIKDIEATIEARKKLLEDWA